MIEVNPNAYNNAIVIHVDLDDARMLMLTLSSHTTLISALRKKLCKALNEVRKIEEWEREKERKHQMLHD